MEPPAFGPWPARFTFSMEIELVRTGREKGEPDAGFPQLPLRRTASLAPGPHRHLAAEKPQERCFQAGRGGIAPWLWRLGEMPASVVPEQATGASPTDPARMVCTPLACLASPIQLPRLPRERPPTPGTRKSVGMASDPPRMLCRVPAHTRGLSQSLLTLTSHSVLTKLVPASQAQGRSQAAPPSYMEGDWHRRKRGRRDTLPGWAPRPCPPTPPNLASVMSIVPSCGTWAHLRFCHQP